MTVSTGADPVGVAGSDLVTKWFSVRAVERGGADGASGQGGSAQPGGGGPLTLVASTEQEDRAGDVVKASGWDLSAYRANPVFLWAHDYRRPAIGKCVKVWVQDGGDGSRLMATIEFAPTPFAQEIRSLYAAGFMRGVSVGFRAIEIEPRTGESGRRGMLFKRQELLEISAAPVPVNPGALVRHGVFDRGASLAADARTTEDPDVSAGVQGVKHEIQEFWRILAGLAVDESKKAEVDDEGATAS